MKSRLISAFFEVKGMICCKIVTNLDTGNVGNLLENLSVAGEFLLANNCLFFCDVDSNITENKIKKFLTKAGYSNYFIDVYDKNNQPRETDEINSWLLNKIMKMNYNICEQENQRVFKEISKGLDLLDKELDKIREVAIEKKENTQ